VSGLAREPATIYYGASPPTTLRPYRPGQGIYARAVVAGVFLLLALFASVNLFYSRLAASKAATQADSVRVLGIGVPRTPAIWAVATFVPLSAVILLLTVGFTTGLKGLDARVQKLIDLLVETESELGKVAWPTSGDLTRDTTAVLVGIVLLGAFLIAMDWLLLTVLRTTQVLPG
jgi:preprotein translocase SecE subunit